MPRMSSQAQRLARAIRENTDLRRREYAVRTLTQKINGVRHYGDAYAVLYTHNAVAQVKTHADALRAAGCNVTVRMHGDHESVSVTCRSGAK